MTTRRALICEDDGAIRALVKTVVQREGFDGYAVVNFLKEGGRRISSA